MICFGLMLFTVTGLDICPCPQNTFVKLGLGKVRKQDQFPKGKKKTKQKTNVIERASKI